MTLDHLDLEQITRNAQAQRRKPWRGRLFTVVLLVSLGMLLLFRFPVLPGSGSLDTLFQTRLQGLRPGGTWQTIEGAPFNPLRIKVSPSGVLWIAGNQKLARFDGTTWTSVSLGGSGTPAITYPTFVVSGEEAWAASDTSVSYYDGRQWLHFPNVLPGSGTIAMAAYGPKAWILDSSGILSRYDGQQWTTSDLSAALPLKVSRNSYSAATLAVDPDGTLWMTLEGLWQFDGNQWQPVGRNAVSAEASILTVSRDRVWLNDSGDLAWISTDKTASGQFSASTLGLADDESISTATALGKRLWVGTSRGSILAYDGLQWQRVSPTTSAMAAILDMAIAPDGAAWAIALNMPSQDNYSSVSILLPYLLPLLGLLAVLGLLFLRPLLRTQSQNREQINVREQILRLLPDLPARNVVAPNGTGLVLVIGIGLLVNPLAWPVRLMTPSLSADIQTLVASLVLVVVLTAGKRWFDRTTHRGAGFVRSFSKEMATSLYIMVFILAVFSGLQWLQAPGHGVPVTFVVYAALVLVVMVAAPRLGRRRLLAVKAALDNANYDEVLARIEQGRRAEPYAAIWPLWQGSALLLLGNYTEAEAALRESLALGLHSAPVLFLALVLHNLAVVREEQNRFEEATRLYETVIGIDPTRDWPFHGLAHAYLTQGVHAERALKLLEQARANKLRNMRFDPHNWAGILATQAWALTLLGETDQVEALLRQAMRDADLSFKPGLASLHYRIGEIWRLRGEKARAAEHFRRASEIDPRGHTAQRAAEALQNL